jgi:hypothetical protein
VPDVVTFRHRQHVQTDMSFADAEALKQQACDEMRAAQRNAWRHPGSAW